MRPRALLLIFGISLISLLLLDHAAVWARATSGGSRGSRSSSSPVTPSTTPSSPSRTTAPEPASSQPMQPAPQRPGMFGGLMGGLAGFALGGLIGSMLFGGMGEGFGGGVGFLELLLIGGAVFVVFRMLRGRSQTPAYAGAGAYGSGSQGWPTGGGSTVMEAPPGESDLDRGIGHIRSMDASFDPAAFAEWAKGTFVDVQAGIVKRDLSGVRDRLTPQEFARLLSQCDELRAAGRTNRIERVQVGRAEVSEAWQESGQDWVTLYFTVSLVDYTVDDATGAVVEGATTPVDIQEYWTFARPVGPQPWRLSAIQTA
jgi:predicted lipid-binding transport protein (Tim44 family)